MITTEIQVLQFLDEQHIPYQRFEHPPVYTCEQAELYRPELPGVSTKNLFIRDKKGRFYLVMTACEKRLDLKALGVQIEAAKLQLGSQEKLFELLGVTPGAVTVLGLVNDYDRRGQLLIDAQVWQGDFFLCHPLVNTATLVLEKSGLERFFSITGHAIHFFPG